MFVELKYTPTLEDLDGKGQYELYSLFKMLENAGSQHSDKANDNVIQSTNNGRAWVLTDWYAEFESYPKEKDDIKVITWSEKLSQTFIVGRDYELYSNGKIFGKATSRWVILDINSGRPLRIDDSLISQYEPEDKLVFAETKLPRIAMPEAYSIEKEIQLRRTDIDYNGHVHNLNYINYAMEVLPEEVYNKRDFKHIHITYKMAIFPGEKIIAKYAFADGKHLVNIFNDKGELKTQIEFA